jgi:geranylgeranyl diphosphate synthase type II
MNNFDLNAYLSAQREKINTAIDGFLFQSIKPRRIINAMRHSVMAGGKRLRPILCLAAAEAVGDPPDDVINTACALEMIHTYSLIHDDLPAMDNDSLRRGQPTCHVAFDEATAILAGDALHTLAFEILSSNVLSKKNNSTKYLLVIHTIAAAAGVNGMIEGQMRDMAAEGHRLGLEDLEEMHALKTGALIEASIVAGAIMGDGSQKQIKQLKVYAKNIGLAFQVTDDILNIEGDPRVLGKEVGTDQARQKNTYPSTLGIKSSKAFAKKLVNSALQALNYFDNRSDPLRAMAHYIIARKK